MRAGYDRRWALNRDATTVVDGRPFHRTGDVGYLDDEGRLFQLGRRMHVITAAAGPLACVVPEQQVLAGTGRTAAAVGVGPTGTQVLVVVVDTDASLGLADLATTAAVRAACADARGRRAHRPAARRRAPPHQGRPRRAGRRRHLAAGRALT